MLSPLMRVAWWALLILNTLQLVNFSIHGVEAKWQVWLCGFSALYALGTLRRDAIAAEREEQLAQLDVKR